MTLRKGEYEITDDAITIKKEVLEQWRDHYMESIHTEKEYYPGEGFYWGGKADVLTDLLKLFEPLKGE